MIVLHSSHYSAKMVSSASEHVRPVLVGVQLDDHFAANIVDADVDNAYPFVGFHYILIQTLEQPGQDCQRRRDVMRFWSYVLTQRNSSSANLDGFVPLTPDLSQYVMDFLRTLTCDGLPLLRSNFHFLDQDSLSAVETEEEYSLSFVLPVAIVIGILALLSVIIFFILA